LQHTPSLFIAIKELLNNKDKRSQSGCVCTESFRPDIGKTGYASACDTTGDAPELDPME